MKPYFQGGGATLYLGDCRDVLPGLAVHDLVLTDPPYGIAEVWKGGFGRGWGRAQKEAAGRNEWDAAAPAPEDIALVMSKGRDSVFWGGNHFELPPSRGWHIWTKPERGFSLSEAEMAWTSRDTVVRVWDGVRSDPGREHPTQKPLALMVWCIERFPRANTVLDPYAGSGTTLLAAVKLEREATGIEREERWCEVAARRIERELAQGDLFRGRK